MATKKFDRTVWHGTDCDKVTSLFEYGLLVRYISNNHKDIYKMKTSSK